MPLRWPTSSKPLPSTVWLEANISVISHGFCGEEALELYRLRWGIEPLFSHLKKRGYQFEETHLSKLKRVEKLFGVLAVAFSLCPRQGQEMKKEKGKVERKNPWLPRQECLS